MFQRHVRDTITILEEGNIPHPRCLRCDILVSWSTLNRRHLATAQCAREVERNCIRLADEEMQDIFERAFHAYGKLLETVTLFKFLGRVITAGYDG